MSMTLLTGFQILGAFASFFVISIILPHFVIGKSLRFVNRYERALFYTAAGNFFVMNLVSILELLHISNCVTLILGTIIPAVLIKARLEHIDLQQKLLKLLALGRRITSGEARFRAIRLNGEKERKRQRAEIFKTITNVYLKNLPDVLLVLAVIGGAFYFFGTHCLEQYAYKASDILVHNYWINGLNDNKIFIAGIYPFGMHMTLYYIHQVFRIDVYVLLRIFSVVQYIWVCLMLVCVLKLCCKSRFTPYIGAFLYIAADFFVKSTYGRYAATLPLEFGMMFVLPAVYFGFGYFKEQKKEVLEAKQAAEATEVPLEGEQKQDSPESEYEEIDYSIPKIKIPLIINPKLRTIRRKLTGGLRRCFKKFADHARGLKKTFVKLNCHSTMYLAGFGMSFAATLIVHFYDTIGLAFMCIGMAMGFIGFLFRKQYFKKVILTCLVSLFLAILPMAVAFAAGTPLQGSLGWAMDVIKGSDKGTLASMAANTTADTGVVAAAPASAESPLNAPISIPDDVLAKMLENQAQSQPVEEKKEEAPKVPLTERLKEAGSKAFQSFLKGFDEYVLKKNDKESRRILLLFIPAMLLLGLVFQVGPWKDSHYGMIMLSTAFSIIIMGIMLSAKSFGLPRLMEPSRTSIFLACTIAMGVALFADSILYLLCRFMRTRVPMDVLSAVCLVVLILFCAKNGIIRDRLRTGGQITNSAITCLTNIIRKEKDFTWTICSANDENRMAEEHGFHYETITFLRGMETNGTLGYIRIPTQTVFFFIEKIPVEYYKTYPGAGQSVSAAGADHSLCPSMGLAPYVAENRWITMSRMYYWAEAFKKLYPNETTVYFESDDFICYRVEQNTYRLFNFAIDYDYNTRIYPEELEE